MKNSVEIETPKDLKYSILDLEDAYVIKIKCILVSNNKFIPYINPIFKDDFLIIGNYSYPLDLIQQVVIRKNHHIYKEETSYNISTAYLKSLLNDQTINKLKKYNLF